MTQRKERYMTVLGGYKLDMHDHGHLVRETLPPLSDEERAKRADELAREVWFPHVIYELDTIGVDGAYEATGLVHFYCCLDHAGRHAIAEGYRTSANYSKPARSDEHEKGTQCEWCGQTLRDSATQSQASQPND